MCAKCRDVLFLSYDKTSLISHLHSSKTVAIRRAASCKQILRLASRRIPFLPAQAFKDIVPKIQTMKRQIFKSIITLACGVMLTQVAMSQAFIPKDAEIALPARSAKLEANVMDVYAKRASAAGADFKGQALSQQQVADLLWCAYGMNRKDVGKLTAPSTMNSQEATLYAIFPSGAYRYDNANHKLIRVATADLRKEVASMQKDMADAPLMLVVVCHPNKIPVPPAKQRECCLIDAGIVSQNISLYCAAAGLKNRPRITMDQDALRKALGLAADDMLVINHPIAL